jgi:hypothetical protein
MIDGTVTIKVSDYEQMKEVNALLEEQVKSLQELINTKLVKNNYVILETKTENLLMNYYVKVYDTKYTYYGKYDEYFLSKIETLEEKAKKEREHYSELEADYQSLLARYEMLSKNSIVKVIKKILKLK